MESIYLKPTISISVEDKEIYSAKNGKGYISENELHIIAKDTHLIYKFETNEEGWYQQNTATGIDYYLGIGASPTILLDNIEILDEECWTSIIYDPTENVKVLED